MAKTNPSDVIETYRKNQERRALFTFADISKAVLLLMMLASSVYVVLTGAPELPALIELKTNTPTYTPSNTPTPSPTLSPTETTESENQCDCPAPEIIVITATFSDNNTPAPELPTATVTATTVFTSTATLVPTETSTPTKTATPTASSTSTPTQIIYTVKSGDTLGAIALRFNITVEALQLANNLDTTLIYEGQVLQIPR